MSFNRSRPLLFVVTLAVLTACAKSADNARADSAAPVAAAHDTGMAGMKHGDSSSMAGMAMTGNPDRDFLRMMSDHHKGLIALAHETMDRKGAAASVREDASKMDKKQDAELDTMTTMLEQTFKDAYAPKVMPENKTMNDSTLAKTGPAFDRAFRETVIMHHQEGIKMMDEYLPKLTDPKVKSMAQRMRNDQTREIAELQAKVGKA